MAAIALFSGALQASAQDFGDPQKGQAFARTVCAECHSVDARQTLSPNRKAPAFAAVAKTSGMTAMALRTWLQTSHPTMPNLVLKSEDRDNIIAYILSLNNTSKGL
jgi:mono/diheme cytochrome c family protein